MVFYIIVRVSFEEWKIVVIKITVKLQNVNGWMISSELLNHLSPNLAWWCIIISQIVTHRGWFALFNVKVTVKTHNEIWLSSISSALLILLQTNFGLMAHHHKLGCPVKRLHCCVVLKVKVTAKVQSFIEFSYGPILSTGEPFVTKLSVMCIIMGQSVM